MKNGLPVLRHLTLAEASLIRADLLNHGAEPVSAPLHNALACVQIAIARASEIRKPKPRKRRYITATERAAA